MNARYNDLENKNVVITGGANGIGESMVNAFHEQGARVHFCDIDLEKGRQLEQDLPRASYQAVDLTAPAEIENWIGSLDSIDVLINNAANDPRIPLSELTVEKWDRLVALNVRSYMLTVRAALSRFRVPVSVINFSSVTFHLAPADMSAYVATKGGILALSRSLARELGKSGVRVNTISPGWVMTERQLRQFVDDGTRNMLRERQCQPDLLEPSEIAEVALFLASSASGAITGQELLADRGWYHS